MGTTTATAPYWSVERLTAMAEHSAGVTEIALGLAQMVTYLTDRDRPEGWTTDMFGTVYGIEDLRAAANAWSGAASQVSGLLASMVSTVADDTGRYLHAEPSGNRYLHEGFVQSAYGWGRGSVAFRNGQLLTYSVHT